MGYEDKRKLRRLKRRSERKSKIGHLSFNTEESRMIIDAIMTHAKNNQHMPRMKLCAVSRDQGQSWSEELINRAITDPELSTLKAGDMVKEQGGEFIYVVVANEAEHKVNTPFQDDPNSPFYLPDGHLYWFALPLE